MEHLIAATLHRAPWNKGKLVGQKAPFKLPCPRIATPLDTPVRADRGLLGEGNRLGPGRLRYPYASPDKGFAHLFSERANSCSWPFATAP
jgi:hypothetical protein